LRWSCTMRGHQRGRGYAPVILLFAANRRPMLRTFLYLLCLLVGLAWNECGADAQENRDLPKVTVHLVHADLWSALRQVCDQAGAKYIFDLEGCFTKPVTLSLEAMPFPQSLTEILSAARPHPALEWTMRHDILLVGQAGRTERMRAWPPGRDGL